MTKNKAIPIRELEEFCSQLSWIKPRVDVTHRWRFVERASANRFDGVAATAFS
jgi:hypothetical protein